jgi:thiol-disulfide isomerase/thioredoxin
LIGLQAGRSERAKRIRISPNNIVPEMKVAAFIVAAFAVLNFGAAWAASAPKVSVNSVTELPMTVPRPYDERANADAVVDAAFAKARKSGKRVLIDLGGNWCPDCVTLANVMNLPNVKPFIAAHYEVASVDVGHFDKNPQILTRFGFYGHLEYIPTVLVAEPNGELINGADVSHLADAHTMTPQAIIDWLAKWTK